MILTCPECKSRYVVNPSALMPHGRTVRCAKCRHSWFEEKPAEEVEIVKEPDLVPVEGDTEPAADDVKPSDPAAAPEPAQPPADDAGEDFDFPINKPRKRKRPIPKGSNLPALQNQKYGSSKLGWISLMIFITAIISSFLLFEDTIKQSWPKSVKLYRAIGLDTANAEVTPPTQKAIPIDDYLKVRGLEPRFEQINGISHLVIAGYVENISDDPQTITPLKILLKDGRGQLVRDWTFSTQTTAIDPGQRVNFETSLPNPPAEAQDIGVTLLTN